jgi:hypothetical protein
MADSFELIDTTLQKWRVDLSTERLRFSRESDVVNVTLADLFAKLTIVHAAGAKPLLRLTDEQKRVHFKLDAEEFATLGAWMGRKRMTRLAVIGFAWIGIAVGVLWLFGSLIGPEIETALETQPFDVTGVLLGVIALGAGVTAKFAPMRGVLVADAAWCTGASIDKVWDVLYQGDHPMWLVIPAVLLGVAYGQLRLFVLIGQLTPER